MLLVRFLGIILTLSNVTASAGASVRAMFSPNGGVKDAIVEQIGAAERRIDVAMYSFSDSGIQNALIAAAKNGIEVRLILDDARKRAPIADKMEENGIDVRYVIPVMHHKFALIDGPRGGETVGSNARLITGSANWSSKSDSSYDEDFLIFQDEDEKLISYQSEFDHLWAHAREYGQSLSSESDALERFKDSNTVFTSYNFEIVPSRGNWSFRAMVEAQEGVAGQALVAAMNGAKKSIQVATTHLRRRDFYDALLAAHERGVEVVLVLDQQEFRSGSAEIEESDLHYEEKLAEAGVDVRYKVYMMRWDARHASQMHSKYMIVDGKKVLAGSFNWSSNSEIGSIENLNILKGDVVRDYQSNFENILSYGGDEGFVALLKEVQSQSGNGPCSFEPISLKLVEFAKLRKAFKSTACR
jgi:phosphatidylserine/phosphatidylglycerophosphate/cardiolipin synthase-like enzyme